jgi:catechol 2,3-dioxygenase-like lactoylglutathione lyase family enzyme
MPLNHVALTVRDRERSAAFYGDRFGLTDVKTTAAKPSAPGPIRTADLSLGGGSLKAPDALNVRGLRGILVGV